MKAGSAADTAWLKETGMKRSEALPATTLAQKTAESAATLRRCRVLCSGSCGTSRSPRTAVVLISVHAAICGAAAACSLSGSGAQGAARAQPQASAHAAL